MISIERQLRQDIAAVTRDVVVTDSDLMQARESLKGRIDEGQRRTRFRFLAVAVVAAVVIPVVGVAAMKSFGSLEDVSPAGPEPTSSSLDDKFLKGSAPTPEQLEGAWRVDNGTILVRFAGPNRISFDNTGRIFTNPLITGTYELAGDTITVTAGGSDRTGTSDCADGVFQMRATIEHPGLLRIVHVESSIAASIPDCIPSTDRWVLEQLLPTSKRIADFALSFRLTRSDREAGVEAADLHGDWMVQGGGYLLEFARDSSYVVVDRFGEFVDQGRWRTRGEELTMTSAPSAGDCTEGDQLVLGDIEYFGYRPVVLRGTVRQNDCGGAWASTAWWMLPDAAN